MRLGMRKCQPARDHGNGLGEGNASARWASYGPRGAVLGGQKQRTPVEQPARGSEAGMGFPRRRLFVMILLVMN